MGAPLAGVDVARLSVVWSRNPDTEGRIALVPSEGLLLGRDEQAGPALGLGDDARVSRRHARIERRGEAFFLVDEGSRHGSWLDGVRVQEGLLPHGTLVRVGDTMLLFERLQFVVGCPLLPEREPLWGPSFALHCLRGEIQQIAGESMPVLVLGETGVGKELVARAVHEASRRPGRFVPVNCAALPQELAERELFGNEAGAFTGALGAAAGLVAEADGGTLFLDEIGELAQPVQAKLLRFLAEGEIRPLGATRARRVDVRVVAATLRDVGQEDSFRADLRARLSGWELHVAPLRERRADIVPLARRFAGVPIAADAAEALLLHTWPRNVRELRLTVEAARVRAGGETIRSAHLPPELQRRGLKLQPGVVPIELRVRSTATPTHEELVAVLSWFEGNLSAVAGFFGKDRRQIYRWMDRFGIERGS